MINIQKCIINTRHPIKENVTSIKTNMYAPVNVVEQVRDITIDYGDQCYRYYNTYCP